MSAPAMIQVTGGGYPNGLASLRQLLDAEIGTSNLFLFRALSGWAGIANTHFAAIPLAGVLATTGGGLAGYVPNEGVPIIVVRCVIYVITKSAGAATLNVGVGATTTTSSSNLITGCDVGTNSAVVFDNIADIGASGSSRQLMTGTQAVTVTGTASTVGFVGTMYLQWIKI